jgi:hypothetical protein
MSKTRSKQRFASGIVPLFVVALAVALALGRPPLARADDGSVTPEQARGAALAWLDACPYFEGVAYAAAPEMVEVEDWEGKQTLAYVLALQPKGFIVVTPRFELNPIIAYSEDSVFVSTETPQNTLLVLLRSDIPARLEALEKGRIDANRRAIARSRWESYLEAVDDEGQASSESAPLKALQSYDVEHGPFLSSVWGQSTDGAGQPTFNYFTPNNYVCGCVATALGQILNYYEWPLTGTGSHSYTWDNGVDPPQTLSADFGATAYDWDNVLDDYTGTGASETERQRAGTVTYHAGVAVDMYYTSGGSGASLYMIPNALSSYFRSTGEYVTNTGDFYDRLYANMVNHRPVELGIRNPSGGGHAVVVDGIRHNAGDDDGKTRYYHLNMGWSGYGDAWYDLPTIGSYDTVDCAVLDVIPWPTDLEDLGTTTTDAVYPVSWPVSPHLDASQYELQQALFSATLTDFEDGAEGGTDDWTIDGYWAQSSAFSHQGSHSFHGQIYQDSTPKYPGTLTLDAMVEVDASTTIDYYWGAYYGQNQQLRLEISGDGSDWTVLEWHTDSAESLTWVQETVTTDELSAYAGQRVYLRFVVDYLGGPIYAGSTPGLYVDDFAIHQAFFGEWASVGGDTTAASRTVTVSEDGEYAYRVRAYGCDPSVQPTCAGQWWGWSDVESLVVSDLYVSDRTGDWNQGSTWVGGSVPPTTRSAVIKGGHMVTVDSGAQCDDLLIESGGALVLQNGATLTVADDWVNRGSFIANNGSVAFNGASAQTVEGDNTFYNLTSANGSGGVTIGDGTLTVSNLLHVQSGSFACASDLHDVQIDSGATLILHDDSTVSGNWSNSGTFTHNNHDVTFDGSSAQTIAGSSTTVFNNLTVNSGATVNIETVPTVAGTLANNGTLQQTKDVNGTSDVVFLSVGDYGGVLLNANGVDLGSTSVSVAGNQNCTDGASGSSIRRCFDISPANGSDRDATLRLYFSAAELGSIPCQDVQIWHWDGYEWGPAGTIEGRDCGAEPYFVEATGVSGFSPFVGDNDKPGSGATAVVLASFAATWERFTTGTAGPADGVLLPVALVALGATGIALLWVRYRAITPRE